MSILIIRLSYDSEYIKMLKKCKYSSLNYVQFSKYKCSRIKPMIIKIIKSIYCHMIEMYYKICSFVRLYVLATKIYNFGNFIMFFKKN